MTANTDIHLQDEGTYEDMNWTRFRDGDENIIVFFPLESGPDVRQLKARYIKSSSHYRENIGITLLDTEKVKKDLAAQEIKYNIHEFYKFFKIEEWLDARIKRPENIKIDINNIESVRKIKFEAFRANRVEQIRWSVPQDRPIIPFLKEKYKLIRKLKAPTKEQKSIINISKVGQSVVNKLQPRALRLFLKWAEEIETLEKNKTIINLPLSSEALGDGKKDIKISFYYDEKFRFISLLIEKEESYTYQEDPKGCTLFLRQELPYSVLNGLKGSKLSKIINIDELNDSKIKSARIKKEGNKNLKGKTIIRAEIKLAMLEKPNLMSEKLDGKEIEKRIRTYIGKNGRFKSMTSNLLYLFKKLQPEQLLTLLEVLSEQDEMNCKAFGFNNWTVVSRGESLISHNNYVDTPTYDEIYEK